MKQNRIPTKEDLQKMAAIDIRKADKESLVDIKDVTIHTELPIEERVMDYLQQIKNPYCYLSHGVTVKISFAGKKKLEDCIKDAMFV
jgi:hypothetical protein